MTDLKANNLLVPLCVNVRGAEDAGPERQAVVVFIGAAGLALVEVIGVANDGDDHVVLHGFG